MDSPRLVIFMLLFSFLFAPISYAFVNMVTDSSEFMDTGLDTNDLIEAGITITNAESENITKAGAWVYYDFSGNRFRVAWIDVVTDYFKINAQTNPLDKFLNTWFFPDPCTILRTDQIGAILNNAGVMTETDVINYFNTNYNWTRFQTKEFSANIFFTPDNNTMTITDQINSGVIIVTLGVAIDETDFNFQNFINWYFGIISGQNSYGLPSVFSWLIRIVTAIQLITAIWVAKDLLSV